MCLQLKNSLEDIRKFYHPKRTQHLKQQSIDQTYPKPTAIISYNLPSDRLSLFRRSVNR